MRQRLGADGILRLDQLGKFDAARQRLTRNIRKHSAEMIAPGDRVAFDVPVKGGLAETGQDVRGLWGCSCHIRLVSGHRRRPLRTGK
jgi:hypothetical protein